MWWRSRADRCRGLGYLPQQLARRLGRRGGAARVADVVKYQRRGQLTMLPRPAWVASTQLISTMSQLAVQVCVCVWGGVVITTTSTTTTSTIVIIYRRSGITSHTFHGHWTGARSTQPVRSVPLGDPIAGQGGGGIP